MTRVKKQSKPVYNQRQVIGTNVIYVMYFNVVANQYKQEQFLTDLVDIHIYIHTDIHTHAYACAHAYTSYECVRAF